MRVLEFCRVHRTPLFCAVSVSLLSAVLAAYQAAPAAMTLEAMRAHVEGEQFGIVSSIRGLPLDVRNELQELWDSRTLDIADPGAEFQRTGANVNSTLPTRRLVAAGCARDNHCLVYYERGGRSPTWVVALFQWTPAATRLEWSGAAPGGLTSIDDVRNALLSGAIKSPTPVW